MTNGKEPPPSPANPNYGKLRRTQRVHILMAVLVRGTSDGKPFEEETKTTTVNAHGCLISMATPVTRGTARLYRESEDGGRSGMQGGVHQREQGRARAEVGLEFTEASPLFWRIGFPPEDWVDSTERKRPGTSAVPARPAGAGNATPPRGKGE